MEEIEMNAEFTYFAPSIQLPEVSAKILLRAVEGAGFDRIIAGRPLAETALQDLPGLAVTWPLRAESNDPVGAARQIAAVDSLSGGRSELRMDADVGDLGTPLASHVARMHYLDEYLVLMKRLLSNDRPFEHQGRHFSVRHGYVPRKGPRGAAIPIRLSGLTGAAARVAARHAEVLELPSIAPEHARRHIARIREMAGLFGRGNRIRFAMAFDISEAAVLDGKPEDIALRLLQYADAGVSEFMVAGLATEDSIAAFARTIQPLASNSIRRLAASNAATVPTKPIEFLRRG
jgi:alkanesulfonate monooxygenase